MTSAVDWSGRVGDVWAAEWRRTDRALAGLATHLDRAVLAAAPAGAFRALDIGCGAGATSLALARHCPDATVTGVDLSAELIAIARTRATGIANLRFAAGDVLDRAAAIRPDLLVSRHGVMFFADPVGAFASLRAAAAPGARLVFSCFAEVAANPWATALAPSPERSTSYVPGPFAFADAETTGRAVLANAGWRATARRVAFTYIVGEGADPVADAESFLTRIGPAASALRDANGAERPVLLARLRAALVAARTGDRVAFPAAAWIWTADAASPPGGGNATGESPSREDRA